MPFGTVKWFSTEKGFGFIEPDQGGPDVFVHRHHVPDLTWAQGLDDGEPVEYDKEFTPKGLSARNVERLSDEVL